MDRDRKPHKRGQRGKHHQKAKYSGLTLSQRKAVGEALDLRSDAAVEHRRKSAGLSQRPDPPIYKPDAAPEPPTPAAAPDGIEGLFELDAEAFTSSGRLVAHPTGAASTEALAGCAPLSWSSILELSRLSDAKAQLLLLTKEELVDIILRGVADGASVNNDSENVGRKRRRPDG